MSFKESVLIPLELFQKIQLSNDAKSKKELILADTSIGSEEKLHLLKREEFKRPRLFSKIKEKVQSEEQEQQSNEIEDRKKEIDIIMKNVHESHRPLAKELLNLMLKYPHIVKWDANFKIYIKDQPVVNSNIADVIYAFFHPPVITKESDIPPGLLETYNILIEIGANKNWFVYKPLRRTKRRGPPIEPEKAKRQRSANEEDVAVPDVEKEEVEKEAIAQKPSSIEKLKQKFQALTSKAFGGARPKTKPWESPLLESGRPRPIRHEVDDDSEDDDAASLYRLKPADGSKKPTKKYKHATKLRQPSTVGRLGANPSIRRQRVPTKGWIIYDKIKE